MLGSKYTQVPYFFRLLFQILAVVSTTGSVSTVVSTTETVSPRVFFFSLPSHTHVRANFLPKNVTPPPLPSFLPRNSYGNDMNGRIIHPSPPLFGWSTESYYHCSESCPCITDRLFVYTCVLFCCRNETAFFFPQLIPHEYLNVSFRNSIMRTACLSLATPPPPQLPKWHTPCAYVRTSPLTNGKTLAKMKTEHVVRTQPFRTHTRTHARTHAPTHKKITHKYNPGILIKNTMDVVELRPFFCYILLQSYYAHHQK